MRELAAEVLLRFAKVLGAVVIGALLWLVATGPGGADGTAALALLCFVAGGVTVLLMESSPL
jgi:hypothetical protein